MDVHRQAPVHHALSTSGRPTASSTSVSISRGSETLVCNSCRSKSAKLGKRVKPLHTTSKVAKRKQVRHGGKTNKLKRSIKDNTKPCVLFYANINGFTSKRDSLKQLLNITLIF